MKEVPSTFISRHDRVYELQEAQDGRDGRWIAIPPGERGSEARVCRGGDTNGTRWSNLQPTVQAIDGEADITDVESG